MNKQEITELTHLWFEQQMAIEKLRAHLEDIKKGQQCNI